MSHCHNEHSASGGHDHDGHDHSHDGHDHSDDVPPAMQSLLYEQIDFDKVTTLNESVSESGVAILKKTWKERLNPEPELKSDADEQLLMTVPFAGQVRLHSILLRTSTTSSAPLTLKLFLNRDSLDFDTATELAPTQTLTLAQTSEVQEHPVKRALFNTTRCLTLFFEDNFGGGEEEETRVAWVAFKGQFMKLSKEPVSVLYEAAANPKDHRIKGVMEQSGSQII